MASTLQLLWTHKDLTSTLAKKLGFPSLIYVQKLFDALNDMIISNSHNFDVLTNSLMMTLLNCPVRYGLYL